MNEANNTMFFRRWESDFINCEINTFLTWSEKCIIVTWTVDYEELEFAITDTKLNVPVVALSAQDNAKLL